MIIYKVLVNSGKDSYTYNYFSDRSFARQIRNNLNSNPFDDSYAEIKIIKVVEGTVHEQGA